MTKDDKINIKLEICKDKINGKLSITAHFNSNAPNVFQDKDSYFWMPTTEEKDLLEEAFELIPIETGHSPHKKSTSKPEKEIEITPTPEQVIEEELKITSEIQPTKNEEKPTDLPPVENLDESSVFEATGEHIKTDDIDKFIDKKIEDASPETGEQHAEESKSDESESEKKDDDRGFIVEADSEAIEAALKKRNKKDESIVEADEQTIVDKVLSQKKKGKWSRR